MHGWVMRYLYENRDRVICQKDIEHTFDIRRSTVTNIIQLMEKKGYVERSRSEEDRRVVLVSLSEKGEKAYFHHRMFHEKMVMEVLDGMDKEETEVLTRALTKLQKFFRTYGNDK